MLEEAYKPLQDLEVEPSANNSLVANNRFADMNEFQGFMAQLAVYFWVLKEVISVSLQL